MDPPPPVIGVAPFPLKISMNLKIQDWVSYTSCKHHPPLKPTPTTLPLNPPPSPPLPTTPFPFPFPPPSPSPNPSPNPHRNSHPQALKSHNGVLAAGAKYRSDFSPRNKIMSLRGRSLDRWGNAQGVISVLRIGWDGMRVVGSLGIVCMVYDV